MATRQRSASAHTGGIALAWLAALAVNTPARGFDPSRMREEARWGISTPSPLPIAAALVPAGAGAQQVLALLSSDTLTLRRFDPVTSTLATIAFVDPVHSAGGWTRLLTGDFDGNGSHDLLALTGSGEATLVDAVSGKVLGVYDFAASVRAAASVDVDPFPGDEIVLLTPDGLEIRSYRMAMPLWTHAAVAGGTDLAVGQIDLDPASEAAVSFGASYPGVVVDLLLRRTEWAYAPGFGDRLSVADLDGSPAKEIVAWDLSRGVRVIDGVTRTGIWSGPEPAGDNLPRFDIDGDGVDELLLRGTGGLDFTSVRSALILRSVPWPSASPLTLAVPAEIDGDCGPEILVRDRSGAYLDVIGMDGAIELSARRFDVAPNQACWAGDIDADGRPELVRAVKASSSPVEQLALELLSPRNPSIARRSVASKLGTGRGLAVGQLDLDPELEYVVATTMSTGGPPQLEARDGLDDSVQWGSTPMTVNAAILLAADLSGDGLDEILAGTTSTFWPGSGSGFIHVFAGSDGAPLWRGPEPSALGGVWDLRAADVTGDGRPEIVGAIRGSGVHVHDGTSYQALLHIPLPEVMAADVADWDGDSDADILTGEESGHIRVFDAGTRAELADFDLGSAPLRALRVADVDGDGELEIVITQDSQSGEALLRLLRLRDGAVLWQVNGLRAPAGMANGILTGELDGDPALELAISTELSLRVYEYADGASDVDPPVWPDATGLRSADVANVAACCAHVELAWDAASDARSPWVSYRVYRGDQPGFVPGPATLATTTHLPGWWDGDAPPDRSAYYIVRAVDGVGNEDRNLVELGAALPGVDLVPSDQGNVLRLAPPASALRLDWRLAPWSLWRVQRSTERTWSAPFDLIPQTALTTGSDPMMPSKGKVLYYRLRGLSLCGHVPGP